MTPQQKIGANIRCVRKRSGMSQRQVAADQERFSDAALCQWEQGQTEPSATNIYALACCFGVPMERFFEGVEWD